ncbi:hypothetical protein [Sulfurimonas sp.]
MKAKKWIAYWFYTISILGIIGVFNYIVDPYQQYRKSKLYDLAYKNSRELNSGLAKNFNFDSIVLGSSMMENFKLNELKTILKFQKPIKLTMPGSSAYEQSIMLKTALKHQKINNILIGIDFLSYYGNTQRLKYGETFFPFYLYDENILNDYKYLISSDTLLKSFEALFTNSKHQKEYYEYDKMYEWHWKDDTKNIISAIQNRWLHKENFDNKSPDNIKKLDYLKRNFDVNLKPLIQKNKQIKFILLFPPYSVLAYKIYRQRGYLKDFIAFKTYIVKSLQNSKNVEIYDFQDATTITHNLGNYYDLYHFKKYVTTWMLEQIKNKKYILKATLIERREKKFLDDVKNYKVTERCFDINVSK